MDFLVVFGQMIILAAMMMMGYAVWHFHILDENANKKLSWIVVNIFNPFLIISGVLGKDIGNGGSLLLQNIVLVIIFYVFLWLFGFVIVVILRVKKGEKELYRMMTLFTNVGFMGIPVITSIFGMESMIYIVFYMLGFNLIMYSYGMIVCKKAAYVQNGGQQQGSKTVEWKRMLNAGVVASLLAVLIFVFQIQLPDPVVSFCEYMGNPSIPLSMMLVGVSMAQVNLKKIFTSVRVYFFILLRMLLLPILCAVILKQFPAIDETVSGVFVLQMGMPVGSLLILMAKECGADSTCCTNGIVLSTLASLLTIPIVCMFL